MVGSAAQDLDAFLSSPTAQRFVAAGRVVSTRALDPRETAPLLADPRLAAVVAGERIDRIVEHERIPFPSYPYEWSPEMLHAAGCLTLDLAQSLLAEGLSLKDATPYNVLFRGPRETFIDVLSVERRDPLDSTWLPYAQFIRTFLLPLLVNRHFHITLRQVFAESRDGLEPEAVYRMCGPLRRLWPPFLTLVSLPTWLGAGRARAVGNARIYRRKAARSPEQARFVLNHLFRHLRRRLDPAAPPRGRWWWISHGRARRSAGATASARRSSSAPEVALTRSSCSR